MPCRKCKCIDCEDHFRRLDWETFKDEQFENWSWNASIHQVARDIRRLFDRRVLDLGDMPDFLNSFEVFFNAKYRRDLELELGKMYGGK